MIKRFGSACDENVAVRLANEVCCGVGSQKAPERRVMMRADHDRTCLALVCNAKDLRDRIAEPPYSLAWAAGLFEPAAGMLEQRLHLGRPLLRDRRHRPDHP